MHAIGEVARALKYLRDLSKREDGSDLAPDVIFIDLIMPVSDGYEMIEGLRIFMDDLLRNTKLVVLTSSAHDQDRLRVMSLGMPLQYFIKPLTTEVLFMI